MRRLFKRNLVTSVKYSTQQITELLSDFIIIVQQQDMLKRVFWSMINYANVGLRMCYSPN